MNFEAKQLPSKLNYPAPDGSEIRLLLSMSGGGLCHCTMPAGGTSIAVVHKTVEEIWHFIQGLGQVWRQLGDQQQEVDVHRGVCLTIPVGTHFQFRNTGHDPLRFVIATMPPWPGKKGSRPGPKPLARARPNNFRQNGSETEQHKQTDKKGTK
jgi:mannose-6-phosphate isomerase-like protein (cupin superfamily)